MSTTEIILMLLVLVFSSFMAGLQVTNNVNNSRLEKAMGNSIENMENLKRDCEKSLPRDKVCVMVFDFVPVENDHEP